MKNSFRLILLLVICAWSDTVFSQTKDSIMAMNRKYKKEIALDFKMLFKGEPGSSLILKIKDDRGKYVALTFSKYYRFQLTCHGNFTSDPPVHLPYWSHGRLERKEPRGGIYISPMLGKERVNFFGRFNIFYGIDVGPFYSHDDNGYDIQILDSIHGTWYSTYTHTYKQTHLGASVVPFFGMKYRLSEHFSASVESGFWASYFISRTTFVKTYQNQGDKDTFYHNKSHRFSFSIDYLRFLNLSYHF